MGVLEETAPSLDSYWRAIILFGRNAASYKFALGQSLLDLGSRHKNFISMEDLAEPFAKHIVRHLGLAPVMNIRLRWHLAASDAAGSTRDSHPTH